MNPKELKSLKLYRQQSYVGKLERTQLGSKLTFASEFIEDNRFSCVGFHIKKTEAPYEYRGAGLPPFFAGLLPEGLRFKALVRKLKTSEDDLFSLLAATGHRVIGDVWIEKKINEADPLPLNKVNFYELFQSQIGVDAEFAEDAIAGVQEKLSASMINLPIRLRRSDQQYILKLNPKDTPSLVQNEFWTLKLAKKVGIVTNKASICFDRDHNPGLLVSRFDRIIKNEVPQMLHQEDLCQLLDLFPADKYRISMQQVADRIKTVSSSWKIGLLKVMELYTFSYLVGNGDLHAKNISLNWSDDRSPKTLSPAYDLISTTIYGDHKMALKLDGRDNNFTREQILIFCERNQVPRRAAEKSLDRILSRVQKNISYLEQIGFDSRSRKWLHSSLSSKAKRLA